jgi:hypothetical protein
MEQIVIEVAPAAEVTTPESAALAELSQNELALVGGGNGIMLFI